MMLSHFGTQDCNHSVFITWSFWCNSKPNCKSTVQIEFKKWKKRLKKLYNVPSAIHRVTNRTSEIKGVVWKLLVERRKIRAVLSAFERKNIQFFRSGLPGPRQCSEGLAACRSQDTSPPRQTTTMRGQPRAGPRSLHARKQNKLMGSPDGGLEWNKPFFTLEQKIEEGKRPISSGLRAFPSHLVPWIMTPGQSEVLLRQKWRRLCKTPTKQDNLVANDVILQRKWTPTENWKFRIICLFSLRVTLCHTSLYDHPDRAGGQKAPRADSEERDKWRRSYFIYKLWHSSRSRANWSAILLAKRPGQIETEQMHIWATHLTTDG